MLCEKSKKTQAERGNLLTTKNFFRSVAGSFEALRIKIYARVQMWQREGCNKNARILYTYLMLYTIKSNYSPIATLPSRSFRNLIPFLFLLSSREKPQRWRNLLTDFYSYKYIINANCYDKNSQYQFWQWRYERKKDAIRLTYRGQFLKIKFLFKDLD